MNPATGTSQESDGRLLCKDCRSKHASCSTQSSREDGEDRETGLTGWGLEEVVRLLQKGHSGINVYLVRETDGRMLARKVRPLSPSGPRLQLEFEIMTSLSHPNIVQGLSYHQNGEAESILMEYCPGEDLHSLISSRKLLPEAQAKIHFRALMRAVAECHRNNVAHLDIKPENCFIAESGELKLGDFGFARRVEGRLKPGAYGTVCYNSPEVRMQLPFDGKAADIFSCGVLLFKLVAGHLPYRPSSIRPDLSRLTSDPETYWKDVETKLERSLYVPVRFSAELKELLGWLLDYMPKRRPSVQQVQESAWLR